MRQTLDQQRAAAAWKQTEHTNDEYKRLVRGTSVHILTNGLGQTLAFYQPKKGGAHRKIMEHIAAWVLRSGDKPDASKKPEDLLEAITTGDSAAYRRLTGEALAYLDWLKRFAEARAEVSEEVSEAP